MSLEEFTAEYLGCPLHPYQLQVVRAILDGKSACIVRPWGMVDVKKVLGEIEVREVKGWDGLHADNIIFDEYVEPAK